MRNQVITLIFVLLVVCDEGKAAPKLDIAPRFEATGLSARFKPQGTDGNVWRIAQAQPVASKPSKSFQEGLIRGNIMGQRYQTSAGKAWLDGFVTGVLTTAAGALWLKPLWLGTGIGGSVGYSGLLRRLFLGPADLDMQARSHISDQSSEYRNGFMEGWNKETRSKKRFPFLMGGAGGSFLTTLVIACVSFASWLK